MISFQTKLVSAVPDFQTFDRQRAIDDAARFLPGGQFYVAPPVASVEPAVIQQENTIPTTISETTRQVSLLGIALIIGAIILVS